MFRKVQCQTLQVQPCSRAVPANETLPRLITVWVFPGCRKWTECMKQFGLLLTIVENWLRETCACPDPRPASAWFNGPSRAAARSYAHFMRVWSYMIPWRPMDQVLQLHLIHFGRHTALSEDKDDPWRWSQALLFLSCPYTCQSTGRLTEPGVYSLMVPTCSKAMSPPHVHSNLQWYLAVSETWYDNVW